MYFNLTKTFLSERTKTFLAHTFKHKASIARLTKKQLIDEVYSRLTPEIKGKTTITMLLMCEFCRVLGFLGVPKEQGTQGAKYCAKCGRTSPYMVFVVNIARSKKLLKLASKMNTSDEQDDKAILLEQSIVSLATSTEVLMRESYSIIMDFKHVIFGESIFNETYKNTKNDFTNIGIATKNFRSLCGLNIKDELGEDKYKKIRLLYSMRHAIVHNNGIKDAEFISQTGGNQSDIGKKLKLTVNTVRVNITALNALGHLMNAMLRQTILEHLEARSNVIVGIKLK